MRMGIVLQLASLVALLALFAAWGSWVWEAYRPISVPEKLGEVVVHGIDGQASEATARALAVGVVGAIAEHYRAVDFVNTAATTANQFLIRPGESAPEPLFLQGRGDDDDRLDITVEFAGAKIDSKGITSLFHRPGRQRGTLALAVSLSPTAEANRWHSIASASFAENSAFGFRIDASASLDEIAQIIGLRFVQAHYAIRDPFYAALGEEDFRKLWEVRREAAELALRGTGGDPSITDPLRKEANQEYRKVAHLLTRYRRRVELQKLGSYLATAAGDLSVARQHVDDARKYTTDPDERDSLFSLLASLDVEIGNRAELAAGSKTPAAHTQPLDDVLAELARRNGPLIQKLNLDDLRRQYPLRRRPRIGVVMARAPAEWDGQVTYVRTVSAPVDETWAPHSVAVLSLLKAVAPEAEIVMSPIIDGSRQELYAALRALAGQQLDVAFWPLGETARSFDKEDGAARWARSVGEQLDAMSGFKGLAVLPAGNDGVALPPPSAPAGAPPFAVVGAIDSSGGRAPYSNYGAGVSFMVQDELAVLWDKQVASQRGSSFSSTAFAAAGALLAATVETPAEGARLLAALEQSGQPGGQDTSKVPDLGAAAVALHGAPGG
jgi:hypothetical protein